ncbi:DUF4422 domain-containing protein [Faecalibaculum rodentium]|uniref:DUF4422 domain-containing protein n=1 Tax=Faecalibaculum rodentium TaxID=1702221 RepID=UPI0023F43B45|nr:DUF4422 domain-containing protein [Faecalibaculum rodentium]
MITIITATHKPYRMPADSMYLPVQVGAAGRDSIGCQRDDEGLNISSLNPYYCELTGLYWGWKNLNSDYIGLAHYRRHFRGNKKGETPFDSVISEAEVEKLLQTTDVILPKKRRYYIESIKNHYAHTHYKEDLDKARDIIAKIYPDYLISFDKHMKSTSSHMFNMFIMKKELADQYCEFLFSILKELQKQVNYRKYDAFQARLFGRISELLLDVWINKNHIEYKEVPLISMEPVPWLKKGGAFLKAKFFGKKYEGSF